jgi:pyrrolidone-carboxylate peptidase
MKPLLLAPFAVSLLAPTALAQLPKILMTGYWPPSNEAVRQFSTSPVQNPGGWAGGNWEARGYDVHSFFPEFSPPTCASCGAGTGDLTVDYQDTSQDFWQIVATIQPIAIITFSRGAANTSWEVEMNAFNRGTWIGDYAPPLQPTPAPPDNSVPAETLRLSTLPVQGIVNAVLASGLPVQPAICASGHIGAFLSEFVAYHGVWYQDIHKWPGDPAWCVAAGHIHVGTNVTWPVARQAAEVSLRELIAHVDAIRAVTTCQQNLGFQGPGAATFEICGGPLNLFGNIADLRVLGAPVNGLGVLALGAQNNPTPLWGGMAVPVPTFYLEAVFFDAQGEWFVPGGLVAPPVPLPDVFAQIGYLDPTLPQSFGLTNALRLTLQ